MLKAEQSGPITELLWNGAGQLISKAFLKGEEGRAVIKPIFLLVNCSAFLS